MWEDFLLEQKKGEKYQTTSCNREKKLQELKSMFLECFLANM